MELPKALKYYKLNAVTFGTTSAPFLAIRCLRQLGKDGEFKYPLAFKAINKNFYVDDEMRESNIL